jgi:hypothetical protein
MTLRLIFGLGWSLVTGMAGGWLVLAPWALGEQGAGDWTTVTRNELGTGLGLITLAVLALLVVTVQSVRSLRGVGAAAPPRPARSEAGVVSSPEMEQALIALAQALADDLDSQHEPAPPPRPHTGPEQPARPATWREQT